MKWYYFFFGEIYGKLYSYIYKCNHKKCLKLDYIVLYAKTIKIIFY